jgi:hypothetical protein
MIEDHERKLMVNNSNARQKKGKAEKLRPIFGWSSTERIMRTLACSHNPLHQDCLCRSASRLAPWLLM